MARWSCPIQAEGLAVIYSSVKVVDTCHSHIPWYGLDIHSSSLSLVNVVIKNQECDVMLPFQS